jgi:hypothetical protein
LSVQEHPGCVLSVQEHPVSEVSDGRTRAWVDR